MERYPDTISFWRGALPHWEVVDGRYFVTLRLANSLPKHVVDELGAELKASSKEDYLEKSRLYFAKIEQWLDKNQGVMFLEKPEISQVIVNAVRYYQDRGYWNVFKGVCMPNHVHLFFECGSHSLTRVMRGFKRYTARECNKMLERSGKSFWQKEWFDHWSRSSDEDEKIKSYICANPQRAGLIGNNEKWDWII